MVGRQNERERASPSIRNFCGGLKSSTEMSPTEKGGQSRTDDGQNFLPELESVEWSEEGSACGKTDRFVKVELVRWEKGESCPLMMGLGLSRNCASWVSLAVEIYTGRGGKSPRLSGMEEAQEMDESTRLTDKDEDGVPFHD